MRPLLYGTFSSRSFTSLKGGDKRCLLEKQISVYVEKGISIKGVTEASNTELLSSHKSIYEFCKNGEFHMRNKRETETFPSALEDARTAELSLPSPQTVSPSYRLAYTDHDFLLRDERPSRGCPLRADADADGNSWDLPVLSRS